MRSYDRLFPSQDTLPNGVFGNLIAYEAARSRRGFRCASIRPMVLPWRNSGCLSRWRGHMIYNRWRCPMKPTVTSTLAGLILAIAVNASCGGRATGGRSGSGGGGGNQPGQTGRDAALDSSETNPTDAGIDAASGGGAGGAGGPSGGASGAGGGGGRSGVAGAGSGGATSDSGVAGVDGASPGARCTLYQFQPSHPTADEILADIDKDGLPDIITVWNEASVAHFLIYRQTGPRTFAAPVEYATNVFIFNRLAAYDLDQDGILDIAATYSNVAGVGMLLSAGGPGYTVAPVLRPPTNESAFDIVAADFDGDGYGDIAVPISYGPTSLGIYWGTGGGAFSARSDQVICDSGVHAAVIDANEDGRLDLAVSCLNSGSKILINQGNRKFASSSLFGSTQAFGLATGDLNHDGHVDVVLPDLVLKQLLVYLGDGSGKFTVPTGLVATTSSDPRAAAMGDLDGDGNPDIVLEDAAQTTLAFYHGTGDGHFQSAQQLPKVDSSDTMVIRDVDGDGIQDLLLGGGPNILYGPCP